MSEVVTPVAENVSDYEGGSVNVLRDAEHIRERPGMYIGDTGSKGLLSKEGVTLLASYEAEQHLLHFGRSDVPACWTICGLTSGYVSRSSGKEIYVLEDRCVGKGDAACHLIGRTRQEWGDERAEELQFFEANRLEECLDVSLHRVTETLKAAERVGQKQESQMRALLAAAIVAVGAGALSASNALASAANGAAIAKAAG